MACYKKHALAGLMLYVAVLFLYHPEPLEPIQAAEWLLCTVVGSLFPDIDIKSKGQTLLYGLFFIAISGLILLDCVLGAAFFGLIICIPVLVKHRGLFHQLSFLALLVSGATGIMVFRCPISQRMRLMTDVLFFLLGIVSHLVLDGKLRYRGARRYR